MDTPDNRDIQRRSARLIRLLAKRIVFPGLNLHARQRYRILSRNISQGDGERWVLDAGCGNGMLSYAAWRKGNRVIGITIKEREVRGCREYYNRFLGIPETELSFHFLDMMEVRRLERNFNEIICCEVLEHIPDDAGALRALHEVLLPGGTLHITSPNADHPDNRNADLDPDAGGGHVRPGYSVESLTTLLAECGFRVVSSQGLGGKWRQSCNRRVIARLTQRRYLAAVLWFAAGLVLSGMDRCEPSVPYVIYLRAVCNSDV